MPFLSRKAYQFEEIVSIYLLKFHAIKMVNILNINWITRMLI